MKKLFLLTAVFAAGLLATSCSSTKEEEVVQTDSGILDRFDMNGQARVNVAIYTPTRSQTRATNTANDQFEAADITEYTVLDATLILFTGQITNEAVAKFQGAYTLTGLDGSAGSGNIDQIYTAYINNDGIKSSDELLALVVANTNGKFTVNSSDHSLTVTTASGAKTLTKGVTTFENYQAYELNDLGTPSTSSVGLFMTNAPLAVVNNQTTTKPSLQGATAPIVRTLAVVDASKIKPTNGSATTDPAIIAYLERAAAKVQVTHSIASDKQYLTGNSAATFTADDITWLVDNVEPTFYAVRNPANFTDYQDYTNQYLGTVSYRFFASKTTPELTGGNLFRTYWAKDPHYNYTYDYDGTPTAETQLTSETDVTKITNAIGTSATQYITENTMNEYGLSKDKTTRVLLKVQFGTTSFFTIDNGDIIYKLGNSGTANSLADKIKEYIVALPAVGTWMTTYSKTASDISVEVTDPTTAGKVTSGITITATGNQTELETALGSFDPYTTMGDINAFIGGNAYYQARIQHFGDTEAPLNSTVAGPSYKQLYCDNTTTANANDFLGRYGVVRNNHYILNITSIRHMGKPTIPTPDTTPDDDTDEYLGVKIYVVDWAKRTQDVDL